MLALISALVIEIYPSPEYYLEPVKGYSIHQLNLTRDRLAMKISAFHPCHLLWAFESFPHSLWLPFCVTVTLSSIVRN